MIHEDRFTGAVIGQCLGDALGFLVEGDAPHVCLAYAREVARTGRAPRRRRDGLRFGQYSDESQLAREFLSSWLACGGFNGADYAARIAALFAADQLMGCGVTTAHAAERLVAGAAWDQAGTPAPAAGNNSAMRAVPVGLLYGHDMAELTRVATEQSRITHADPRCAAGAVVVAAAVAQAASDWPIEPDRFLAPLRQLAARIEPTFGGNLRQLLGFFDLDETLAAQAISRTGLPPGVDSQWRGGISAYVVSSLLWALYVFLRHPDDYMAAVTAAIAGGGDVDTTASLVGALVGARKGLAGVPQDLAVHLTDQGAWGFEPLVGLAQACRAALAGR